MARKSRNFSFLSTLFIYMLGFSLTISAQDSIPPEQRPFSIGKVSVNPKKQSKEIRPMANYISSYLAFGGGDTVFTQSIDDMLIAFRRNQVDLFTGSAYEASVLINSGLGEAIALKEKQGQTAYHSIIVSRRDSGIDSLEDLNGKLIGFEDISSTSAYFVPRLELEKDGFSLIPLKKEQESIVLDSEDLIASPIIHYRFSQSEKNSAAWLYRNIVDAIAISDSDWDNSNAIPEYLKQEFQIIYRSPPIPRAVEVVRSNLPVDIKEGIQSALFAISDAISSPESYNFVIAQTNALRSEESSTLSELQLIMDDYHKTQGFKEVSEEIRAYLAELAGLKSDVNMETQSK